MSNGQTVRLDVPSTYDMIDVVQVVSDAFARAAGLDDAEIEAVLGHELTHIRNGDVQMMVVAMIIAGVVGFFGEMMFRLFFQSNWSFGGGGSSSSSSSQFFMKMPTTSCPCRLSSQAVTAESTPPLKPTTMRCFFNWRTQLANAAMPVMARPRIKACMSCVPS